ncbi:MAG: serine O-acetyltransferase [Clostridia bacterium]|nr:serine O-acetyltransferase [Clostridia bacterium]
MLKNYIRTLCDDVACVRERDPASSSALEVFLLYPGVRAVRNHRLAHWFYENRQYFLARLISNASYRHTGIDIHPGAKLGERVFIDHGNGVVIGETAEVGDDVTIYQGATLGGTGKDVGKRHPTVGNNVMIGAGAKVLGPMNIGENTKIAAGSVVLSELPANCTAVGVPARIVRRDGVRLDNFDHTHLSDPLQREFERLEREIYELKEELRRLKGEQHESL